MIAPRYFKIYEFLPEAFYEAHRRLGGKLWLMFDDRLLQTVDWLRDVYGPITLNDWWWAKGMPVKDRNHFRGWRPWDCIGASLSQHKFGRAADCMFRDVSAEEVRQAIKKDPYSGMFRHINCIEDETSWLHFDVRCYRKDELGILIIKP